MSNLISIPPPPPFIFTPLALALQVADGDVVYRDISIEGPNGIIRTSPPDDEPCSDTETVGTEKLERIVCLLPDMFIESLIETVSVLAAAGNIQFSF